MKANKQLKNEYKRQKFKVGVFQIRNIINDKIYVGSSVNLVAIWNRNKGELAFGGHRNELLQAEWKQFGEAAFRFETLAEINQDEEANTDYNMEAKKLEAMFIEELQPFGEKGYHTHKI